MDLQQLRPSDRKAISMTDCTTEPLLFAGLKRQSIQADFGGGRLTSDGGALLLREVDRSLGLIDAINACIDDPRNPFFIAHSQRTLLAQRIFGIALGYEDLNDHQRLREDPLFQVLSERGVRADLPLASPPTLCCLENRVNRQALGRIAEVFVETFLRSQTSTPEELILDFDPTNDPVHGNQEMRFFHGYYDQYCFLPLYVFCGSHLLVAYLRPANIDGAKHSRAILKLLVRRFRRQWPNVRIIFRGDSGFARWKLMRWRDKHNVGLYPWLGPQRGAGTVGAALDGGLRRAVRPNQPEATALWGVRLRGRDLGPGATGHRESRASGTGSQQPVRRDQSGRRAPAALRRGLLASRGTPRTGSKSSSWACSPTGPVARTSWPTSSACCCRRRRTSCWIICADKLWPGRSWPKPKWIPSA
jgi:hypothetical protein